MMMKAVLMKFKHSKLSIEKPPKLVRDKIVEIQKAEGKEVKIRVLKNDKEFLKFLSRKMIEEAYELEFSLKKGNLVEELADILEVIETILKLKHIDYEKVRRIQKLKRKARGGFNKRILFMSFK